MWRDLNGVWINELVHADPDLDPCYTYKLMQHRLFLHQIETATVLSLHLLYLNVAKINKFDWE
jgi:hypothetical protein